MQQRCRKVADSVVPRLFKEGIIAGFLDDAVKAKVLTAGDVKKFQRAVKKRFPNVKACLVCTHKLEECRVQPKDPRKRRRLCCALSDCQVELEGVVTELKAELFGISVELAVHPVRKASDPEIIDRCPKNCQPDEYRAYARVKVTLKLGFGATTVETSGTDNGPRKMHVRCKIEDK